MTRTSRWIAALILVLDAFGGVVLGVQYMVASRDFWYSGCDPGDICDRPSIGTNDVLRYLGVALLCGAVAAIVLAAYIIAGGRFAHPALSVGASATAIIRLAMAVAAQGHPGFNAWLPAAEVAALVELPLVFAVAGLWHHAVVHPAKAPPPPARPPFSPQAPTAPPFSLQPPDPQHRVD